MTEIILHHYPTSPFSEKVRAVFGFKRIAWSSVTVPVIMPKPDLMPLTGGYRKTPVMQIGADIWCDTQAILRELDRRFPEPSLLAGPEGGIAEIVSFAADRQFFWAAVAIVMAHIGDKLPDAFREDRTKFSGREFDAAKMRATLPYQEDQVRGFAAWTERALSDGRPFLFGETPSVADLSLYHSVWFMHVRLPEEARPLRGFALIEAWRRRIAAFGNGEMTELAAAAALDIAREAAPAAAAGSDATDPAGRRPGQRVTVSADDTGRDPVSGRLVRSAVDEIVIAREDPRVGLVHVHFPRAGFIVRSD